MFAYCNNNPVNCDDPDGHRVVPVLTLADYAIIHKMVQMEIVFDYGYAMEVFVLYPEGKGRLDLFDPSTNQYYEVKHKSTACLDIAAVQMRNYDKSVVHGSLLSGYYFDDPPSRGTNGKIRGSFQYDVWDVYYELYSDGLIVYTTVLNKQRLQQELQLVTAALCGVATGLLLGSGNSLVYKSYTEDILWSKFIGQ